jgi:hypothetical protein
MNLTGLTNLIPGPIGIISTMLGFLKRHLPAFCLLLPLVAVILVGMSLKGDNKALQVQVQLEQARTAKAKELANAKQATIDSLLQQALLQQGIQDISDEAKSRTADVSFWRAAAERLRKQANDTGCLVHSDAAETDRVHEDGAEDSRLAGGVGRADRLANAFEAANTQTQQLIVYQAAWELMERTGVCEAVVSE